MNRFNLFLTLALIAFLLAPAANAQERQISGYAAYIPGHSNTVTLADGRSLVENTIHSVLIEDDPQSPTHLMAQDCGGTNVLGSDGTPIQIVGSCTAIDADGDLFYISYQNTPEGGTWRYMGGTGKFDGVEGDGTTELVAMGPDGRLTIRYEGTINMR